MRAILFLFFLLLDLRGAHGVIRHHNIPRDLYASAALDFPSVVKIVGQQKIGLKTIEGSGVLIASSDGKSVAILTAAHVLEGGEQFSYFALIDGHKIPLKKISSFLNFLSKQDTSNAAIAIDLREKKSYFGTKLPIKNDSVSENLKNFGIDLALAFLEDARYAGRSCKIASELKYSPQGIAVTGVGFGQGGSGGPLYGYSQSLSRNATKMAFETVLYPGFILKLITFDAQKSVRISTLVSYFEENNPSLQRPGQVGGGDSGGGIFRINQETHSPELIAIIIANLPYVETSKFKKSPSHDDWLLNFMHDRFEKNSPLSSFFWQEANIYGSEGYYIDVTNPICALWMKDAFEQDHASASYKPPSALPLTRIFR
jgi:hypothetical protein